MTPEQMLDMARKMKGKIAPLEVYIIQQNGESWMVPVPNDDSSKWPTYIDEQGNEVKMPPLQPVELKTEEPQCTP